MIKFTIQAEVDESKRSQAKLPETAVAASPKGAPKSKVADARVARKQKRLKEVQGE